MIRRTVALEPFDPQAHIARDGGRHGLHPDDVFLKPRGFCYLAEWRVI